MCLDVRREVKAEASEKERKHLRDAPHPSDYRVGVGCALSGPRQSSKERYLELEFRFENAK